MQNSPQEIQNLRAALERMLKVYEALMPGIKYIAVQNYAEINEAPLFARKVLAEEKSKVPSKGATGCRHADKMSPCVHLGTQKGVINKCLLDGKPCSLVSKE